MATQHRTAGGFIILSGADRAAARLDRDTWLNHKPARGGQMAIAMVDSVVRSPFNGAVEQRVAQAVRTMR